MSNEKILLAYHLWLQIDGILSNTFRKIGYTILETMYGISNFVQKIFIDAPKMDLINNYQLNNDISTFRPLFIKILVLSLMFVGYKFFYKKIDKASVVRNVIFAGIIFVTLPFIMVQIRSFTYEASSIAFKDKENPTEKAFKSAFFDLNVVDEGGFKSMPEDIKDKAGISAEDLRYIDINERISEKSEVSKLKLISKKGEELKSDKLRRDTIGDFRDEHYYRWGFRPMIPLFVMLVMVGVAILGTIKVFRLLFELVFSFYLVYILGATDLEKGERLVTLIQEMIKTAIEIFMVYFTVYVYTVINNIAVSSIDFEHGITASVVSYITFSLAGFMFIKHGSSIQQKMLNSSNGNGLKNEAGQLFKTMMMTDAGMRMANSTVKGGKALYGVGKKAFTGGKNAIVNGVAKAKDRMNTHKPKNYSSPYSGNWYPNEGGGLGTSNVGRKQIGNSNTQVQPFKNRNFKNQRSVGNTETAPYRREADNSRLVSENSSMGVDKKSGRSGSGNSNMGVDKKPGVRNGNSGASSRSSSSASSGNRSNKQRPSSFKGVRKRKE